MAFHIVNEGDSIQAAINSAAAGDTIYVAPGTYTENIQITKSLTLLSLNGSGSTIIQGSAGGGGLGTIMITPGVNDVIIGDVGQGFHVIGYDGPSPAIEHAAIYLQGAHSGITIRGNNVEAAGDAALMSEYNAAVSNIVIDQNEFSGTTFVGQPGVGNQFEVANVARPLVFLGTNNAIDGIANNISFTNNQVTGTAGGTTVGGQNVGNNLVNIDATDAVITGNTFTGFTNVAQLRSREENPIIENNDFSNNAGGTTGLEVLDDGSPGTIANNTVGNNPVVLTTSSGTILGFDTIQEALNAAPASGGVITVAAGTYVEQLLVNGKDVKIVGAGEGQTIIAAPDTISLSFVDSASGRPNKYAVVAAVNNANLDISGVTIDGRDNGQFPSSPNGDFVGLYGHNSSIDADEVTVTGIRDVVVGGPLDGQPSGAQRTHAVIVTIYSGSHTFEMTDSTVSNFQKNAFALFGAGLTINLVGNEIIGAGEIGSTAQNGIQLSGGATGNIEGNTISGIVYAGDGWASSGIILFDADGVSVINNIITGGAGDNEYGIYMSGIDGATITGNTLSDLGYAIAADGNYTTPPDVSNNTFNDNYVNFTASPTGPGPFTFVGTAEADLLQGSNLNDNFHGNGGEDYIDGNGGVDTVHYTETLDASNFSYDAGTGNWTINAGGDNVDTVREVEVVDHGGDNNILLVGGGGYATIQEAIDAAGEGDTILIAEGTYNENVVVNVDGLTIVAVGNVVIEGTFHTDNTVVGDTYTWLADTPSYSGASGAGVTIDADNVTLQGVTIQSFLHGVSFGDGVDSTLIKDVDVKGGVMGYHKPATSDVSNLTIEGGSISDVYIGMDVPKTSTSGDGNLIGFTINGTSFFDITQKGLYIETLYNALITNIDMTNVGQHGGGSAFGAHGANGAGIDINLKYESDYNDITISDFTMTDVGLSNGTGGSHDPGSPHGNSGAITIKARNDGPSYNANPAEFDGIVQILNGVIDGTSTGIRIGESGKTVAGPAANIQNVTIIDAVVQDYINQTLSQVVVGDGTGNDLYVGNIAVNDTVAYTDSLDASDFSFAGGTWSVNTATEGNDTLFDIEVVEHGGAGKFLLVGNGGFDSIQAAINAAADGDTILVAPGTYDEDLLINKAVTILGAQHGTEGTDGRDAAAGTGEVNIIGRHDITATGDVTIDGVRFVNDSTTTNGGYGDPIVHVLSDYNHTIANSIFYSLVAGGAVNDIAIMIPPSASGTISITDNYFTGSSAGLYGTASWGRAVWFDGGGVTALVVTGNTFEYVRSALNLDMSGDATASVTGNDFKAAGSGVSGGIDYDGVTIEDNSFGTVDTDFNFQNLEGPITFDAAAAVAGVAPTDGFITILGSKGSDNITLTEFADVVDGKGGIDTLVYDGKLTDAEIEYDNTLDVWTVTRDGVTDILRGVENLTDGTNEVRLVGGGSEYDTIEEATQDGFDGTVLTASEPTAPTDEDTTPDSVAEGATKGTTVGLDVTASDAETGVTYSLVEDADGAFQIDAATGVVTVLDGSKLDYETATSHDIVVRATNDYGAFSDETFTIQVTDVGATLKDPDAFDPVAEGTSVIGNVIGSGDMNGLTFAILQNIDGPQFAIDEYGNLSFVTPPDYENPADVGGDNTYRVTVAVSNSSGQSDIRTFDIKVENADINGLIDIDGAADKVAENAANGTVVGLTISGTDGGGDWNAPFANTKYTLVNDAEGRFTIDEDTGVVRVLDGSKLDFEDAEFHVIRVRAENAGNSSESFEKDFTIDLEDVAGNIVTGSTRADEIAQTSKFGGKTTSAETTATIEADEIYGGNGNDKISGLAGDDLLDGGAGNDILNGDAGNDRLIGGKGVDTVDGGVGDDIIVIESNFDQKDTLIGNLGFDTIEVAGTKVVTLLGFDSTNGGGSFEAWAGNGMGVKGTGAANTFNFSNLTSVTDFGFVDGAGGNDTIIGSATVGMELRGGSGNDTITGGAGEDRIIGGAGVDVLDGGNGNDTFVLTSNQDAKDTIQGGLGTDTIEVAGKSNLTLNGFDSNASSIENWVGNGKAVVGSSAADTLDFSNIDTIGGGGISYVDGGNGNDTLIASDVGMQLRGGSGNDTLVGGAGIDRLEGGAGNDDLTGGAGADTFVFAKNTGLDTIQDFELGVDTIEIKGVKNFNDLQIINQGGNALITINNNTTITLVNVDHTLLTVDDFNLI